MVAGLALVMPAAASEDTGSEPPAAPSEQDVRFFQRVSSCAAVFKAEVLVFKRLHEGGDSRARAEMLRLTELTFTLIGKAYLRGLRGPEADAWLDAAEAEQAGWDLARRNRLKAGCEVEATRLLEDSSFIERALVRNRAAARVDRLLKR